MRILKRHSCVQWVRSGREVPAPQKMASHARMPNVEILEIKEIAKQDDEDSMEFLLTVHLAPVLPSVDGDISSRETRNAEASEQRASTDLVGKR